MGDNERKNPAAVVPEDSAEALHSLKAAGMTPLEVTPYTPAEQVRIELPRDEAALDRVVAATLDLRRIGGRGVLVPGGFVLTAAHCIDCTCTGCMTHSPDDHREVVHTRGGRKMTLAICAVEPVADIAILGAVDDQRSPREAEHFEDFCGATEPVPLYRGELMPGATTLAVLIYNKNCEWVPADVTISRSDTPTFCFVAEAQIERGASGGPIVTPAGELVGLASTSCTGVRPLESLPARFAKRIAP